MATQLNMEKMREMYPWLTDKQISDMQVREDILFRRYLNGEMNQEEYVKRAKALANEYAKPAPPTPPTPPTATNWLPTTAYGEHLKTRIPHPEPQGIPIEGFGNYGIPLAPGTEYPLLSKRHIPGFFGHGSLQDWMGQDWLARIQQLLDNLPAPFKNWLSNYPRLPQSTIPSPAVEYPAPGRPPKYNNPFAWKQPEYQNPFAWRRKNNGWW